MNAFSYILIIARRLQSVALLLAVVGLLPLLILRDRRRSRRFGLGVLDGD